MEIPNIDLLEFIASGAFGWVFAARVRATGLTVAVKILRNDYAEAGGIAAREALVAASLRHRGILRVFDVSSTASYWVLVMELVRGKGIDKLPLETAATLVQLCNLASSLQHMGDRGIVHRDIKPSNIIVRDCDTSPVIIDFGLAVNLATYVHDDVVAGTHYYMSPECLRGEMPSPSFDAYSLGVTFCYLLLEKKWPISIADVKAKLNGRFESELRTRIDSSKQPELAEYAGRLIDCQPANRLEAIRELADRVGDDELAECA